MGVNTWFPCDLQTRNAWKNTYYQKNICSWIFFLLKISLSPPPKKHATDSDMCFDGTKGDILEQVCGYQGLTTQHSPF